MTKPTREQMIHRLIEKELITTFDSGDLEKVIAGWFRHGLKGYEQMTDAELAAEYQEQCEIIELDMAHGSYGDPE